MAGDSVGKVFSEREAIELVHRAAELQEQASEASPYVPGVTLEELQRIAAEAGVDPAYVLQALRQPESEAKAKRGPMGLIVEFERVVDGEIPPEDFDIISSQIRTLGKHPSLAQVGRSLTAQAWTGWSVALVEVLSRHGRTRVNVRSNGLAAFFGSVYPAFLIGIIGGSILAESGQPMLAALVGLGAAAGALFGFTRLLLKGHRAAQELADRLANTVEEETTALRARLAASEGSSTSTSSEEVNVSPI